VALRQPQQRELDFGIKNTCVVGCLEFLRPLRRHAGSAGRPSDGVGVLRRQPCAALQSSQSMRLLRDGLSGECLAATGESAARIFVTDVNLCLLDAMKTLRSLSITLSMASVPLAARLLVTPEVSAAIQAFL
jgi:hypothetical protein